MLTLNCKLNHRAWGGTLFKLKGAHQTAISNHEDTVCHLWKGVGMFAPAYEKKQGRQCFSTIPSWSTQGRSAGFGSCWEWEINRPKPIKLGRNQNFLLPKKGTPLSVTLSSFSHGSSVLPLSYIFPSFNRTLISFSDSQEHYAVCVLRAGARYNTAALCLAHTPIW